MSFVSLQFALFLPLTFLIHFLGSRKNWQNTVLVVASYLFYAAWDYRFCVLMLVSSLIDYAAGLLIFRAGSLSVRRTVLWTALIGNVAILGFFKYFNFFVDSAVILLAAAGIETDTSSLSIILPIGISFYTFQTMSYTIDIYRGQMRPERNLVDYFAFVSFFPQLVAGPIERASHLLPQFKAPRAFSQTEAVEGSRLVVWGLIKKMIIADNLGVLVQYAYGSPHSASGVILILATIAFAFQIYGDFSGYSDIAAGTARLFGIRLMRNFAYPYFAESFADFWRRWHVSLSTWFRDYVYIPLGGSHGSGKETIRNIFVTFLLSGLWHGAAWKFILWGGLHAMYLTVERGLGWHKPVAAGPSRLAPALRIVRTFALVCAAWVLFRAEDLGEAMLIWRKMFGVLFSNELWTQAIPLWLRFWPMLVVVLMFVSIEWVHRDRWNPLPLWTGSRIRRWAHYTLIFWTLMAFGTRQTKDFIYFQF